MTRYRTKLVRDRARETQRIQKLLEEANIKLDSVVTEVLGKAARRMLDALMAGERDLEVMADMALTRMRPKIGELRLALEGRFDDHHALAAGSGCRLAGSPGVRCPHPTVGPAQLALASLLKCAWPARHRSSLPS